MRRPIWLTTTVALTVLILAPVLCANDWFSHNGNTVEEVVNGPAGQLVVMKTTDGTYKFLSPQSPTDGQFQVAAIGSEQVRLREKGKKVPVQLPILHRNLTLDLLCYCVLRQQGKNVIIAAPLGNVKEEYRQYDGDYREELSMLLEIKNSSLVVYTDTAIVGKGSAPKLPKLFTGTSGDERPVRISEYNIALGDLLEKLEKLTGKKYMSDADGTTKVSIHSNTLTPSAILYYLNGLLKSNIVAMEAQEEEKTKEAPVVAKKASKISKEKAIRVFKKVKVLAKKGETKKAALLLRKLIKRTNPNPKLSNTLAKLYWKLGARKRAVKCLKYSLKVDPSNKFARNRLMKIKKMLARKKAAKAAA